MPGYDHEYARAEYTGKATDEPIAASCIDMAMHAVDTLANTVKELTKELEQTRALLSMTGEQRDKQLDMLQIRLAEINNVARGSLDAKGNR